MPSAALSQDLNKIVFGPLVGDSAGILTVRNGEEIAIEMWIHADPENPSCIIGLSHGLITDDAIIAERNGVVIDPYYDEPYWESVWVDGPFDHNPEDPFPIPEGHTGENQVALGSLFGGCDSILHILPDTGWVYYGSFLMVCNDNVPLGEIYYPFSIGWYPHSGQGTSWSFDNPPGGSVEPEQDYCGLYFVPECDYVPGDCDHDGTPWRLTDVVSMIAFYRGFAEPPYTCYCPPHDDDYPPGADPDGSCVPYELSDVVIMITMFRGPGWPPSGCLDCRTFGRVDSRNGDNENLVPTLKSKAKIEKE